MCKCLNFVHNNYIDIIAILISLVCTFLTIYFGNKNNKAILKSEYFDNVFKKYFNDLFPKSFSKLSFDDSLYLINFDSILDDIESLRKDICFFKFYDKKFYLELEKTIINLDEYINGVGDKKIIESLQPSEKEKIANEISKLYKLVFDKYFENSIL